MFLLQLLPILFSIGPNLAAILFPKLPTEADPDLCTQLITAGQDEIRSLPGLTFAPNFKQFSGFLKTTERHLLHYWFVTSQSKPCEDPLIFWFNGGPGCSSMEGLLSELGPYFVNPDGKTLRRNPNAWNKNASIVFIESPVGVGYSHSSNGYIDTSTDDTTAEGNYEAIKQFLGKFPLFRRNPMFITGESYAGIYVPTLVAKIVDGQTEYPVNLEGMAIGNGYVNIPMDTDTLVRFAYAHGLVSETIWKRIESQCCAGCADSCDLGTQRGPCREMVADIYRFCWRGGLNPYDLYRDCYQGHSSSKIAALRRGIFRSKAMYANETILWEIDEGKEKLENNGKGQKLALGCTDDSSISNFMNDPQVRSAIHIPQELGEWTLCSHEVGRKYLTRYSDMTPFVLKALRANLRVLLYYGDTDMACNFLLGQRFSDRLGLATREEKEPWYFGGQIAGFKTVYERGLTYITVRGAGHMVPEWRASQMEHAFRQFLLNRPI